MSRTTEQIGAELSKLISGDVDIDIFSRLAFSTDASIYQVMPHGVFFPQSAEDVQAAVELAAKYAAGGADEICFLDITASSDGRETMLDVVRRTAQHVFVPLSVGGGVRSVADMRATLRAGADKVGVNTAAIARPELIDEIRETALRYGLLSEYTSYLVLEPGMTADGNRRFDNMAVPMPAAARCG